MTQRMEWPGRKRIVRFEVEDEEGTVTRLRGAAADAWVKHLDEVLMLHQLRAGASLLSPRFEVVRRGRRTT